MTPDHVAACSALLHETEVLKLVLRIRTLKNSHADEFLALICHVAATTKGDKYEEAALLWLCRASPLVIKSVLAIRAGFTVQTEQISSADGSADFLVRFGKDSANQTAVILQRAEDLKDLLAETRRLQAVAQEYGLDGKSHEWLNPYQIASAGTLASSTFAIDVSPVVAKPDATREGSAKDALTSLLSPISALSVESVRDQWIVTRMSARQADFVVKSKVRIWVGTYNVAETLPVGSLTNFLAEAGSADLVVCGLQEVDLRTKNLLSGRISVTREAAWASALAKALIGLGSEPFVKISSLSLGSVAIHAFVRDSLASHSQVSTCAVAVGVGNIANKGATAIRIRCRDSVWTFCNVHLSAFEYAVERRNQEIEDITRRIAFVPFADIEPWVPRLALPGTTAAGNVGLSRAHALFWFGDLNYRITMNASVVKRFVADCEWKALWSSDQLQRQQGQKKALVGFNDGLPRFPHPPTYKYAIGKESMYDASEKQRTPSWTDRILWISKDSSTVEQLSLQSHRSYTASDHKPVSALFEVDCNTIDEAKRLEVRLAVLRELDAFENEAMPNIEISPADQVTFATLRYGETQTRSLRVANVGSVVAEFRFLEKPDMRTMCKPWLQITPDTGLIVPGESEVVTIKASVDRSNASQLNFADDDLSDVLVLSLSNGRDIFLTVSASSFRPTCFGNSLEQLARMTDPIRELPLAARKKIADQSTSSPLATLTVPRVIERLIGFLGTHGLSVDALFVSPGDPLLVAQVRSCLDCGDDFPPTLLPSARQSSTSQDAGANNGDLSDEAALMRATDADALAADIGLLSVAHCLLQLLDSLSVPVVPQYHAAVSAGKVKSRDQAFRVAASLAPVHEAVFTEIMALLKTFIARHHEGRDSLSGRLAIVWAKILLRPPVNASAQELDHSKAFVEVFLVDT